MRYTTQQEQARREPARAQGRVLSLAHLTIAEATPTELSIAAAKAGFAGVGLRITGFTPQGPGPDLVGRRDRIRSLRGILADGELTVTSVCTYRLTADRVSADYARVFEACCQIGASTILITCFIEDHGRAEGAIAELSALADGFGLRLGLEFLKTSAVRSLDAAEALRRGVGAANVGHIVDALHLHRCGHRAGDLARLPAGTLYGIQLCDAGLFDPPRGSHAEVRDRLYPGEGELPLLDLLDCAGPASWIEIEAPNAAHAALPVDERATHAFASGRTLLEAHRSR
jgi:sugar phosphate isomerase/epimerase